MAHTGGAPTTHAGHGGPRPASMQPAAHGDRAEKRDLASWWKNFKSRDRDKKSPEQQVVPQGIFGIPLQQSIRYANVAISLIDEEGQSYIYGYVPIIVAKCGVYLKEKATDVEGIFRLAGSEKRIKELKVAFDSPDRFGKGLDWTGYTVHDAANILRRYFNQLPEPIIPLEFYEPFRDPLKNHQAQAVGSIDAQSPSVGDFDQDSAIRKYQGLITELPPLNRQLLLYILDLLAVFASKSDMNKMTTANLAAIFQPGILSHPQHDMAPQEYRLSQDVLIFLIENQDSFLIGMQGTGADQDTIREVQAGAPTPTKEAHSPGASSQTRSGLGRSASNASAGADSIRKWGSLRRNVSVSSSKHSKRSEGRPVPVGTPPTPTGGSVHRSNTVPSRRGGSNSAQNSPRFSREHPKTSDSPTPTPTQISAVMAASAAIAAADDSHAHGEGSAAPLVAPEITSPGSSEATTPLATAAGTAAVAVPSQYQTPKKDTTPLLSPPPGTGGRNERASSHTPSTSSGGRGLLDIFKQSPTSDAEGQRKPNKLQKKRVPSSNLSSAHSSNHDLLADPPVEPRSSTTIGAVAVGTTAPQHSVDGTDDQATPTLPHVAQMDHSIPVREPAGGALRATSPVNSYRSTNEDTSDADFAGDDLPREQVQQTDRERKRHRWRFSRSQNKIDPSTSPPSGDSFGAFASKEHTASRSTVGSSGGGPRRSFQEPTPLAPSTGDPSSATAAPHHTSTMQSSSTNTTDPVFSDSERDKKGPMRWIRGKIQEHKDKEAEKRARTAGVTPPTITAQGATSPEQVQRSGSVEPLQNVSSPAQPAADETSPVTDAAQSTAGADVSGSPTAPAVIADSAEATGSSPPTATITNIPENVNEHEEEKIEESAPAQPVSTVS